MKFKSLCATSLLAVAALTFVGATNASASSLDTTGTVIVEAGTLNPSTDNPTPIDPEDPATVLPPSEEIITNPDSGSLLITHVSKYDFGTIQTGAATITKNAAPLAYTIDGKAATRGAIVEFGDVRTDKSGYTVSAAMTNQFTNGSATLGGATIEFTNPLMTTASGSTGIAPSTLKTSVLIGENHDSAEVATAATGEGKGLWVIEYGQSADYTGSATTATDATSVTLTVPAATAASMASGTYVATVTWTITAAA